MALAMVRQLQWVAPGGWRWRVASIMALTFSGGMDGLRPRPFSILVRALSPSRAKRSRQSKTVGRLTPRVLAMVRLGTPSAAIRITLARRATPWGVLGARRQPSRTRRWSSATSKGAADSHMLEAYWRPPPIVKLFLGRYTRSLVERWSRARALMVRLAG